MAGLQRLVAATSNLSAEESQVDMNAKYGSKLDRMLRISNT